MKRTFLAVLGFSLLFFGTAVLFGAELARRGLQKEFSRLLGVPIRIERVIILPHRLTLRGVTAQVPAPVLIEQLEIEGNFLSPRPLWLLLNRRPALPPGTMTLTGLNLSVAGVPVRSTGRVFLTSVPNSYALIEGRLSIEHPFLRGELEIAGRLLEPVVLGWVEGVRIQRHHFVGQWRIRRDSMELIQMEIQGGWKANGRLVFSKESQLNLDGPETKIKLRLVPSGPRAARATLWMYREGLIPKEISAEWEMKRSRVRFAAALSDGTAELDGWLDFRPPYPLEATLKIRQMQLTELAQWIQPALDLSQISGRAEAEIHLSGPLREPVLRGEMSARRVQFNEMQIDLITARFEGRGSRLRVDGTVIPQPNSLLMLEGGVDLRRIGQPDFFSGVRLSSTDQDVQVAGWQMRMTPGSSGIWIQRPLPGSETGVKLGLNYDTDTTVPQEPLYRQGVEVQYPIGSEESVRVRMEKDEQFLGVEHRKKF